MTSHQSNSEEGSRRPSPPASRPSPPSLIYRPCSYVDRLDLPDLFALAQPLEVELGSGDGSFLAEYARTHPDHNFLGVERLLGRLRKLDRKGLRLGLSNLRLIRLEASYLVDYLLPANSVRAVHVYFPDPWPKRRHEKHRLITPRFVETVRLALEPRGRIYFRTDSPEYFEQIAEVFAANPAYQAIGTPGSLTALLTDFERDFQARGIHTLHAAFERMEGA
ncbi:MAG: tRNA (guanosine(46)-N7)-methyltransferase TrmB [Verrucomicrobia bacterium]|nr:tRNA (guanosine(46)-N7)-methyltransferase TrmB [Verrucomicrobiota bacterium]